MRRVSTGIVGGPIVGSLSVDENDIRTIGTDIDLNLSPNGAGQVKTSNNIFLEANAGLRLGDADSSNYVELASPATMGTNITYTWPGTITAGYVLATDTNGNLSWVPSEVSVTNDTTTNSNYYPAMTTSTGTAITGVTVSSSKLFFNPSTGRLNATTISDGTMTMTGGSIANGTNITISGTMTAGTITETSSIALKEDINPIASALESVLKLDGKNYIRKATGRREIGLIAEEVEKVIPEIVEQEGDYKSINYSRLSAYLIEAVKHLKTELDNVKNDK
jgi:hypothetical protein